MTIEVRQLLIRSQVGARAHSSGAPGVPDAATARELERVKAQILADSGQRDLATAAIEAAVAAKPRDPALLNSRCWIKATLNTMVDTALKDCAKSIELSDSPEFALDSRAISVRSSCLIRG